MCLQELFNSRYFCQAQKGERFELAEPIPGPTTATLQALARELEIVVIVPLFERQAAGIYRNSAAIIDADGTLLGVYRKMHIPDDPLFYEKYYFTPGDATQDEGATTPGAAGGFRVWQTRFATIGVLICWDQWYPEAARITSLLGAEILFYPTAIGWHPSEKGQFGVAQVNAWRTIQRSHAIANGVYVAAANRVGHEPELGTDGLEFFGHSFVSDPFGRVIAEAGTRSGCGRCDLRYRRHRRYPPQLAVLARSPHRRLPANPGAISWIGSRGRGSGARGPSEAGRHGPWLASGLVPDPGSPIPDPAVWVHSHEPSHARRVGAARRDLGELAPPRTRLAEQARRRALGIRGNRAGPRRTRAGRDPRAGRHNRRGGKVRVGRARGAGGWVSSPSGAHGPRVVARYGAHSSRKRRRADRARAMAIQRVGQVRQLPQDAAVARRDRPAGIPARDRGHATRPAAPLVLEGGAIDVNGEGVLLATEECLLSDVQVRNAGLTREGYESSSATISVCARRSGLAQAVRGTTRTAMWTTSRDSWHLT